MLSTLGAVFAAVDHMVVPILNRIISLPEYFFWRLQLQVILCWND